VTFHEECSSSVHMRVDTRRRANVAKNVTFCEKGASTVYMMDEHQLVEKCLQGDTEAFEELVKHYERLVFSVSARLIDDREDLEDVCQEVFLKVYRKLGGFRFRSKLSTWIAGITYRTSINYLRKYRRHSLEHLEEESYQDTFSLEDEMNRRDLSRYLEKMIGQLPLHHRTVITLFYVEGFSYEEIVSVTGFPEGTVKSYLFRARQSLKEHLLKYENEING
jgi:RNA polymerase sigma factor (sigma-70 family)